MNQDYSVLAASQASGVSPEVLRAWERRYKAVHPKRLPNGRRVYTQADIEKLKILNQLTHEGHAISQIAPLSLAKLSFIQNQHKAPHNPLTTQAMEELAQFNIDKLSEILERAKLTLDTRSFVLDFASPLMAEVGRRVEAHKISIAQEHLLSSILRSHFGTLLQLSSSMRPDKKIVFTTPEGDFHEFGILLCAALSLSRRFGVHYLGPNLPAQELTQAVSQLKPAAVVIGTTMIPKEFRKINLGEYFDKITKEISPKIPILIGGDGYQPKRSEKHLIYLHSLQAFDKQLENL